MKKKINVMVSVLLCMMSVLAVYRSVSYIVTMAEGGNAVEAVEIPEKDRSKEIGTEKNPFILLEIVPHESMATFSYLIDGCEPVDLEKVGYSRDATGWLYETAARYGLMKSKRVTKYAFVEDLPEDLESLPTKTDQNLVGEWITSDSSQNGVYDSGEGDGYAEYGYYKQVEQGTGDFIEKQDGEVTGSEKAFSYVGKNQGNFRWVKTEYYYKVDAEQAQYDQGDKVLGDCNRVVKDNRVSFEPAENGAYKHVILQENIVSSAGIYPALRTGELYYRQNHFEFENPDCLLENAFGTKVSEGFVAKAVVMTPDQLVGDNLKLIERADLITISGWEDDQKIKLNLWNEYNKKGIPPITGAAIDARHTTFRGAGGNDLNWETTLAIVKRMAGKYKSEQTGDYLPPPGLLLQQNIIYTQNCSGAYNIEKLFIMLMQYGAKRFQENYIDSGAEDEHGVPRFGSTTISYENKTFVTGYYSNPKTNKGQETLWNDDTFSTGDDYQDKALMDRPWFPIGKVETNDTIITFNGDKSPFWEMNNNNIGEFDEINGSNKEMFDYYENENNGERPENLTYNDGFKFILRGLTSEDNYKKKLRILELQPCAKFIYGSENWKLYYGKLFPWFTGDYDNPEQLSVTTMASIEFNADITDINSEYDMILCGLNQNESNGKNGYNDPWPGGLGNLRYTSLGGLVDTNNGKYSEYNPWKYEKKESSGTTTVQASSSKGSDAYQSNARYSGNDITKKKYEELKDFLAAGKPIVVTEDFYQWEGKIDTSKVDQSSYIYKLVTPSEKSGMEAADPMNQALTKKETLFRFGKHSKAALKEALAYENCKCFLQGCL